MGGGARRWGEWIRPQGACSGDYIGKRNKRKEKREGKKGRGKKEIEMKSEGYYGHCTLLSTFYGQEKLFCQTFFQNSFSFIREFAPPTQPQHTIPNAP
jgi:hypothetical protein